MNPKAKNIFLGLYITQKTKTSPKNILFLLQNAEPQQQKTVCFAQKSEDESVKPFVFLLQKPKSAEYFASWLLIAVSNKENPWQGSFGLNNERS